MKVFPINEIWYCVFTLAHLAVVFDAIQRDRLAFLVESRVDAFLPSQSVGRLYR